MSAMKPDSSRQPQPIKSILFGLIARSGTFLVLRQAAGLDLDPALIVATFVGAAVGIFHFQTRPHPRG